ncbi:nardilysin [Lepeophtheirus salmonis]|uniref:nardilysin n=1 Tax=Lepeophtheirus salmonis TaxID=72036 RepID=UPI003AF35528
MTSYCFIYLLRKPLNYYHYYFNYHFCHALRKKSGFDRRCCCLSMSSQVLPQPRVPSTDGKEYRCIKLENGLTVLLIADTRVPLHLIEEEELTSSYEVQGDGDEEEPEEEEEEEDELEEDEGIEDEEKEDDLPQNEFRYLKNSAAGLCVGVGSFSDPDELPGLAHFLEHMIFMGSEKFPDENSFTNFISNHGGSDNASTDSETTVFQFETQRKYFREGLDRFAQFFIGPLLKKDSMMREREAVDSEFQMALQEDMMRKQQLFACLSKKDHPMGKFSWGNIKSLVPENMDEDSIRKILLNFRERHYTAQSMTLAVQSQDTLDNLQSLVEMSFSSIPNNGLEKETFGHLLDPFKTEEYNKIYKVVPIQNIYELNLNWAFPPLMEKYKVKPLHYLSWIIGHEGKGSLISFLRDKVMALNITAGNSGCGFEMNSTYSSFLITIELTKAGFEKYESVIEYMYSYLTMLVKEGPSERIFNEIQKIEKLDFDFGDEELPLDNVQTICENMQFYSPERYLDGDNLMFDYDETLIKECTETLLNSNHVNVIVMAREFSDSTDKVEPWFKTKYSVEDISKDRINKWKSLPPNNIFHLPEVNKYIAENTEIKSIPQKHIHDYPVRILKEDIGELFYKKDELFKLPRAIIYLHFSSDLLLCGEVENSVCLDLMVNSIVHLMVEDTYAADLAQMHFEFFSSERGIVLKINGLNDKLGLLLSEIVKHLKALEDELTPEKFEAVKEQTTSSYFNYFIKPTKAARDLRLSLLQNVFYGVQLRHSIIDSVDIIKVKNFASLFKKQIYIQGLVQGNVTLDDAKGYFNIAKTVFNGIKPIPIPKEVCCNEIPIGEKFMRIKGLHPKDNNTVITNYYQYGPGDIKTHALFEILCLAIEEPVFDVLRSKEQLGYLVFSTLRNTYGIFGVSITINSQENKHKVEYVDERIEAFLNHFNEVEISCMTETRFQELLETLIKMKKAADVSLEEEMGRHWCEIVSREYVFDRNNQEAQLYENNAFRLKDLKDLMKRLFLHKPSVRKLSVQVVGTDLEHEESNANIDECTLQTKKYKIELVAPTDKFVTDLESFKNTLKTHPVIHITK